MKGPSLRYDLRVLRVFHCDACGREAQAPGNATSHTCPCSDPPKFMRPLERPRTVSPDVSAFISPAEPEDAIEEVEVSDEDYVPYVPILPPRPERFPNRRKLSDDIEKYQGTESSAGPESSEQHDPIARRDEPVSGRGPDRDGPRQESRRDRPSGGDRSGARPAPDNRDRRDRGNHDRGNHQPGVNQRDERPRAAGTGDARRESPNDRLSERSPERGDRGPRNGPSRGRGGRGSVSENSQDGQRPVAEPGTKPAQPGRARGEGSGKSDASGARPARGRREGSGTTPHSHPRESEEEFGVGLESVGVTAGTPGRVDVRNPNAGVADADLDSDDNDGEAEDGSSVSAEGRPPRRRNRRRGRRRGRGQAAGAEGGSPDAPNSSGNAAAENPGDG